MTQVKFLDLKAGYLELKADLDAAVARVLDSGQYILGDEVVNFENDFAKYVTAEHCVSVSNGLSALVLSLRALNIGEGDEVIVPANTFIATWFAVSEVGAIPVPVDADPQTFNIDIAKIEAAITEKTKAIIPVHLYGRPVDLDPILKLAREKKIWIIEDAAQAHGAEYLGKRIGAHSDLVCWSFYPGKNLGAFGDAGAITTNNAELAEQLRLFRNYGSSKKYFSELVGTNSRLDPIQAAVLSVKLKHLSDWNERRSQIAQKYNHAFSKLDIITPNIDSRMKPSWHLYVIRTTNRDAFQSELLKLGVETQIHYPVPPLSQKAYSDFPADLVKNFSVTQGMADEILSLPIGPQQTEEQTDAVIAAVTKVAQSI